MKRAIPLLLVLAASTAAAAAPTRTDMVVAGRALSFMDNPPSGDVMVGIVYAPSSHASSENAQVLYKLLEGGLRVGNLNLKPALLSVDDLTTANVRLFFLVAGVGAEAAKVTAATRAKRIPCITTDIQQVENGVCTMGIRSEPKVEILVNRSNAANCGIAFSTAFRMMITEL
jgi:hypothetical protein